MLQGPLSDGGAGSPIVVRPTRLISYAWGDKYLGELLTYTLPAVLAHDNLPSLVNLAPCEVALLVQEQYRERVSAHPAVERIRRLCPVRLVGLDDLIISADKYGMSLTYALHRGMIDLGSAATQTHFLFLNADFVTANGSLRSVLLSLMKGERLVAAPSYCVDSRNVLAELSRYMDPNEGALSIPSRALAQLALSNLHNTIKGKVLNQSEFHLRQMDQFYWRVDDSTLLGHQMPVAIVGMRPECLVGEPNSYWDHGLIREFCPRAEPHILGDSDDFLMIELREKEIAREQIVAGPADPRRVGEAMIGWVTPYQRAFAEYPLTLHAVELPLRIATARAKLAAHMQKILSHTPAVLPSHRDHPQWTYHLRPFMEGRHSYLSSRLGAATETKPAPNVLTPIDRVWWKLDGLKKRHKRQRESILRAREDQMEVLRARVTIVSNAARERLEQTATRLVEEFTAAAEVQELTRVGHSPPQALFLSNTLDRPNCRASAVRPDVPSYVLEKHRLELARNQARTDAKIAQLKRTLHAVYLDYEDQLRHADQVAQVEQEVLERSYRLLLPIGVTSALIPQVSIYHHNESPAAEQNLRLRMQRLLSDIQRAALLLAYQSSLRRTKEAVAEAFVGGARNVLIIIGDGATVIDQVVVRFPGVRAMVGNAGVRSGNLALSLDPALKFDLCIWELESNELLVFDTLIGAISFCMKPGAMVVGLHLNDAGAVLPLPTFDTQGEMTLQTDTQGLSRVAAVLSRSRRAIVAHGHFSALKIAMRRLAFRARIALSRPNATSSDVREQRNERLGTRTAITVVGRLPKPVAEPVQKPHRPAVSNRDASRPAYADPSEPEVLDQGRQPG